MLFGLLLFFIEEDFFSCLGNIGSKKSEGNNLELLF
jgi:hypothetical protein